MFDLSNSNRNKKYFLETLLNIVINSESRQLNDKPQYYTLRECTGKMYWWTSLHLEVTCGMDFALYPMDSHTCKVYIGSVNKDIDYEVYVLEEEASLGFRPREGQKLLPFETE